MFKIMLLVFSVITSQVAYAEIQPDEYTEHKIVLNQCTDNILKVEFLCHPDWNIQSESGVLLIIIAKNPYVTFTVSRWNENIIYLDELSIPLLQALGGYRDDFEISDVSIAGSAALEVKAYSIDDNQTKMLDYLVIHKAKLYRFQFTVKPAELWGGAENILSAITQSIRFID